MYEKKEPETEMFYLNVLAPDNFLKWRAAV